MHVLPPGRAGARATWFPGDPAGRAVHASQDVELRRAVQMFVVAVHARRGFDNGGVPRPREVCRGGRADGDRGRRPTHRRLAGERPARCARGARAPRDRRRARRRLVPGRGARRSLEPRRQAQSRARATTSARHVRPARPGQRLGPTGQRSAWRRCRHPGSGVLGRGRLGRPALAGRRDRGPRRGLACLLRHSRRPPRPTGGGRPGAPTRTASGRSDCVPRRRSRSARSSGSPQRSRSFRRRRTEHVRESSQVLFVVDVSRSMLASDGPAATLTTRARQERRATSSPAPCPTCRPASQVSPTGSFPTSSQRPTRRRSRTSSAARSSSRHRRRRRSRGTRRASSACRRSDFWLLPALCDAPNVRPRHGRGDRAVLDCGRGACARRRTRLLAPGRPGLGARRARLRRRWEARERIPARRRRTDIGTAPRSGDARPVLRRRTDRTGRRLAATPRRGRSHRTGEARRAPTPARAAPRGRRTGACGRARSGGTPAPFGARGAGRIRWCHDSGGPKPRERAARAGSPPRRCSPELALASVAGGAPGGVAAADGDWTSLRSTPRQRPSFAADGDHPRERVAPRQGLLRRLPEARPRCAPRSAVVSARDRRQALRDDERRQRLRARRRYRQGALAVQAAQQRALQELRHRRQPGPRVLRRRALHRAARHEARRAATRRRQGAGCRRDQPRRPGTRPRTTATRRRARRSARTTASSSARRARSTASAAS